MFLENAGITDGFKFDPFTGPPVSSYNRQIKFETSGSSELVINRLKIMNQAIKLPAQKGYFQIPMRPADIPETAIITPIRLFKFLRLPFGLRNSTQTFQRMVDKTFGDLPFCSIYLDDILFFLLPGLSPATSPLCILPPLPHHQPGEVFLLWSTPSPPPRFLGLTCGSSSSAGLRILGSSRLLLQEAVLCPFMVLHL